MTGVVSVPALKFAISAVFKIIPEEFSPPASKTLPCSESALLRGSKTAVP